ncbi:MAG: CvpA family protein [Planctomycetota bacterium]|nr:CvpA family protein [Planctomycetota bacterium]
MTLTLLLLVVFLITTAMLWNEGLWNNALSLIHAVLAGLVAANGWEILADYLTKQVPEYTYVWDFLSMWIIFCVTYAIFRATAEQLSKHRIKFKLPVEQTGRILFAIWTGWIMVCFTMFSLHTAPISKNAFRGGLKHEVGEKNFLGLGPDLLWLALVQSCSKTSLSRTAGPDRVQTFDPYSNFRGRYAARRAVLEKQEGLKVGR